MTLHHQQAALTQLDQAQAALTGNQPAVALRLTEEALQHDPDLPEARLLQIRAHLALQQPRAAQAALDALTQAHPSHRQQPETLFLQAQTLLAAGETSLAQTLLTELAQRFPDDSRPHRMLAGIHLQARAVEKARQALAEVVRLEPSDASARRLLVSLLADGQADLAADLAVQAGCNDSRGPMRLHAARLLRQAGRLSEAMELYQALLAQYPEDAALLEEAGVLADELGADDLARLWLRRAVKLNHGNQATARYALALAHLHAGCLASAGGCFWQLTRRDSNNLLAQAGVLVTAILLRRSNLVRRQLQTLARHHSKLERRAALAKLWPHAAMGFELMRTRGSQPTAHPHTSVLDALLRRAQPHLSEHARQYPHRADAQYHLAVCSAGLRDFAQAEQAVYQALEVNPDYAAARRLAIKLSRVDRRAI